MITTRLLPVDSPDALLAACRLLREGDVVAFPTETVYGLGANALDANAVEKIFAAKKRPNNDPLIVHVHSLADLARYSLNPPPLAYALAQVFWPGPLTLVLRRAPIIPPNVCAGLDTVGLRMPSHSVARKLLQITQLPIAAPSANQFSHTSPTTAQHVWDDLNGRIPLILDGGPTNIGVESTILDLTHTRPRLLRPGGVSLENLRAHLPDIELPNEKVISDTDASLAPGQFLRHYAPNAPMVVYSGSDEAVRAAIRRLTNEALEAGQKVGLLIATEDAPALADLPVTVKVLGALKNTSEAAHRLFAALRDLEADGVTVIVARMFPAEQIGLALQDRLMRAAEGRVIYV
jgi:L-threonylcarbamoyladenylate synthase